MLCQIDWLFFNFMLITPRLLYLKNLQQSLLFSNWLSEVKVDERNRYNQIIWACAWQNQQNDLCAQRRLRSAWASSLGICPVWSVFVVRLKKPWVLSYTLSAHQRLWSDWVDAQADLSIRWAHRSFCWFWCAAAHISCSRHQKEKKNKCYGKTALVESQEDNSFPVDL